MIRLIVTPEPEQRVDPPTSRGRHVRFTATLNGEFVVLSAQPLVDAARVLIERGYDPNEPITMRHTDKPYDSFKPMPLSYWAARTYWESVKLGLTKALWMPRSDALSRHAPRSHSQIDADHGE